MEKEQDLLQEFQEKFEVSVKLVFDALAGFGSVTEALQALDDVEAKRKEFEKLYEAGLNTLRDMKEASAFLRARLISLKSEIN